MILLSGFLDTLFRALIFIGLALSVGGVIFRYIALRPTETARAVSAEALRRAAFLIGVGALGVAVFQFLQLLAALPSLADQRGVWPVSAFLATTFARAGIARGVLALAMRLAVNRLQARPRSSGLWAAAAALGALVMVAGAWLTHGASRMENEAPLMTVTIIHQLAAAAWIGGVIHLTAQWLLLRRSAEGKRVWPQVLARFSPLALGSAVVLVGAGLYLSWNYIRDIAGLAGTAYGAMVVTKVALMLVLMLLGGINFVTIRRWKMTGDKTEIARRTPVFAQVESGVGIILLMAAAALVSQPPAVDVLTQRATVAEVVGTFAPKMPRLTPAPFGRLNASATSPLDPFALPTELQVIQSDFNHNVSGIFVMLIGIGAFVSRLTRARWARYWPLLFFPFGLFLLLFAEPTGWPLGKEGFWATLMAPEVIQHRLATLLVGAFGVFLLRVQTSSAADSRWSYLFPMLCGLGGMLLLTHSHSIYATKWAYLIEVSHNAIGVLAVMMGASAFIELRLPGRESRIAGLIWPVCLFLVGVVLLFYRETLP